MYRTRGYSLPLDDAPPILQAGDAYEEAVISYKGSSIRFFWKEIKAQFKGGYLRYPPKSTLGKLTVGTASTVR